MSQQLTIELPDDVMLSLNEEAAATGKTVAEVVADRLARSGDVLKRWGVTRRPAPPPAADEAAGPRKRGERLRKWAGSADSGLTDVSTNVHEYLGRAYLDTHEGPGNG